MMVESGGEDGTLAKTPRPGAFERGQSAKTGAGSHMPKPAARLPDGGNNFALALIHP